MWKQKKKKKKDRTVKNIGENSEVFCFCFFKEKVCALTVFYLTLKKRPWTDQLLYMMMII